MKTSLLSLLFIICASNLSVAQKISFEKSYEEARKKSQSEQKPLFVFINIKPPVAATNFLAGLNIPEVILKFKDSFISYQTSREDTATSYPLIRKYKVSTFPAFIFIDTKGGILFKDYGTSTSADKYLRMADRALTENKEKSLVRFDQEYELGVKDSIFLRDYIIKRRKAGIMNNAKLIDEFVTHLTVKDLEDQSQVLFILEAGPFPDSKAYRLAYTYPRLVDSLYKILPLAKRGEINNTIINNTMQEAIALKSITKLSAAANFTRNTWQKDYVQGQKNATLKHLQYYRAVKDTSQYFIFAGNYYDQYYMHVSADSINRLEKQRMEKHKAVAFKEAKAKSPRDSIRSFSFSYSSNNFSTELNNAAYSFYQTGTTNLRHLTKAILWSKRSIELNPQAGFYDTLAHLLYRMGFYAEAESTQLKAVELARSEKQMLSHLQKELEKIKKRTL